MLRAVERSFRDPVAAVEASPRLRPLRRADVPELEPVFAGFEENTGNLPNNVLIMARRPDFLRARAIRAAALRETTVDRGVRDLVTLMIALVADCRYSQAHRMSMMARRGVPADKIRAVRDFETSPLFDERERSVLRFARDAAAVPSAVADAHVDELRRSFTEDEIVDLVAHVCNAAWSNRWNDIMATPLEPIPLAAMARLDPTWDPGRHRP